MTATAPSTHPVSTRPGRRLYLTGRALDALPALLLPLLLPVFLHSTLNEGAVMVLIALALPFVASAISRPLYHRATWYVPYRDRTAAAAPFAIDLVERVASELVLLSSVFIALHVGGTDVAWGAAVAGMLLAGSCWVTAAKTVRLWWWWRVGSDHRGSVLLYAVSMVSVVCVIALAWAPATARPDLAYTSVLVVAVLILGVKLLTFAVRGARSGDFHWSRPTAEDHPGIMLVGDWRIAPDAPLPLDFSQGPPSTDARLAAVADARARREGRADASPRFWRDYFRSLGVSLGALVVGLDCAILCALLWHEPSSSVAVGAWWACLAVLFVLGVVAGARALRRFLPAQDRIDGDTSPGADRL